MAKYTPVGRTSVNFDPQLPLYHYTNERGRDGIGKSKVIQQSTDTPMDLLLGVGVYLTHMPPTAGKAKILANNYPPSRPGVGDRADYAFKFPPGFFEDDEIINNDQSRGRDIKVYNGSVTITSVVEVFKVTKE